MPRKPCGCAGTTCSCVIVSSDGSIIVTGSGTPDQPIDLSAGNISLGGRIQVQDTATVKLSMPGEGTQGEPYVISAVATLNLGDLLDVSTADTTVGYVLARQGDQSFALVPPNTSPVGAIATDATIDGDGSGGDPLTVHDYANIAWLEGAEDNPNLQWINVGALDSPDVYGYRVQRENQPGELATATAAEFRLYDYGNGLAASIGLIEDGVQSTLFRMDRNGSINITGVDGVTVRIPWRTVGGQSVVNFTGETSAATAVSFPPGAFTDPPRVMGSVNQTPAIGPGSHLLVSFSSVTTSGMIITCRHVGGATVTGSFDVAWEAVQDSA